MGIPDVTAYRLDLAMEILEKAGVKFYLKKIALPVVLKKRCESQECCCSPQLYRVLKQVKVEKGYFELTIAAEISFQGSGVKG